MSRILATAGALLLIGLTAAWAGAATAARTFTIYARAVQVQFINHYDDRTRSVGSNPFNADTKSLVPLTNKKEQGNGPFPGDNALYRFKLYQDANLKKPVGSAVISCTFNFARHALCDADYELNSASMFASGPTDFNSTHFTFAITGGANKYFGASGQVTSAPAPAKNSQRLQFTLR